MSMIVENFDEILKEELQEIKSDSLKLKILALRNLFELRKNEELDFIIQKQELSKNFENKYVPLYEKRTKVTEGETEVSIEDVKEDAEKLKINNNEFTNEEKGIPGFWSKAICNCFLYQDIVNERDKEVLLNLYDVRVKYLDNSNFSINFYFHKNKFFEQDVLTKTCIHSEKNPNEIIQVKGTKIEWKSKDLNPTLEPKKLKKAKSKTKTDTIKYVRSTSFFNIFEDFDKDSIDKEDEENEDAPIKDVSELEREYDDAIFLKDDFIPNAYKFYLGISDKNDDSYDEESEEQGDYKILQEIDITKPKNHKV